MIPQTLLIRILVAADVALVGFGVAVGPLVPGHGGGRVSAEPAGVAHEGPLVGVFEPHVLVQSSFLHRRIITITTLKPHRRLLRVLSHDMVFQHMLRNTFEVTKLARKVLK